MTKGNPDTSGGRERATLAELLSVTGPLEDAKASSILATGASLEEIEEATALAAGESDVLARERIRANAVVAAVYDILTSGRPSPDEERRG